MFPEIIQLPRLVACMEYLLGSDCILSDMGARSPLPGIEAQVRSLGSSTGAPRRNGMAAEGGPRRGTGSSGQEARAAPILQ